MQLILDLEATCWENPNTPDLNEIIDIGIVVCNDSYEPIMQWHSLVRPKINKRLSSFCRKLTGIKQNEVDKANVFEDVIPEFYEKFYSLYKTDTKNLVWYTWGGWDLRCVLFDCERAGIGFPFGEHKDLKDIYSEQRCLVPTDKRNLKDVIIRENLGSVEGLHRAIADASATAKIAKLIFSEGCQALMVAQSLPDLRVSQERQHGV